MHSTNLDGKAMDTTQGTEALVALNESAGGDWSQMLLLMVGMAAIVYFMMIRPGQKEKQAQEAFQTSLTKGDKVVTDSGIHGKVTEVGEGTVALEVASKTTVTIDKVRIARRLVAKDAQAASK